jgi:hypothetical protein
MDRPLIYRKFKYAAMLSGFLLILVSDSIHAQSSPPLLSNDPGTPGPGKWEINVYTSWERSAVDDSWQIPLIDVNYGVGERCQLTATMPFVIRQEKGAEVRREFDGIEVGIKYRFLDNPGKTGLNMSFYPKVFFSLVQEKSTKLSLPLQWHYEWSHFGLTAELGHIWVNGESDGWEGGVGVALMLDRVSLFAEWHTGVREAPFDLRGEMITVGATWEWSETVSVFASYGKSIQNHEDSPKLALAGFQFRF